MGLAGALLDLGHWLADHSLPTLAGFVGGFAAIAVVDWWKRRKRE